MQNFEFPSSTWDAAKWNEFHDKTLQSLIEKDEEGWKVGLAHLQENYKESLNAFHYDYLSPMNLMCHSIEKNNLDFFKQLLEYGADPSIADKFQCNSLHYMASYKRPGFLKHLRNHLGVQKFLNLAKIKDRAGYTPLMMAVQRNNILMVVFLLECGVNPNNGTNDNWTPMHIAAQNKSCRMVRILHNYGASLNIATISTSDYPYEVTFELNTKNLIEELMKIDQIDDENFLSRIGEHQKLERNGDACLMILEK